MLKKGSKTAHTGSLGDLQKGQKAMNTINENQNHFFEDRTHGG